MHLFRSLNSQEEEEFRQWARENFNPESDQISSVWHPVVQDECAKMRLELHREQEGAND